ncbi:Hypothetical predicted protein [Paramuricea clavata]|uniref:Uncharacterized protein n=1 Tax=Paramuricea clavata TaxID=317549 RepID=A0A6S7GCY1_PARCT|nr:Hypothetical predicted protein [Paramuricea clavata]
MELSVGNYRGDVLALSKDESGISWLVECEQTAEKLSVEEQKIKEILKQYEKLKTLLDQKTQSRTLNTSTTLDTISTTLILEYATEDKEKPKMSLSSSMVVKMEHCLVCGTLCQQKHQRL